MSTCQLAQAIAACSNASNLGPLVDFLAPASTVNTPLCVNTVLRQHPFASTPFCVNTLLRQRQRVNLFPVCQLFSTAIIFLRIIDAIDAHLCILYKLTFKIFLVFSLTFLITMFALKYMLAYLYADVGYRI